MNTKTDYPVERKEVLAMLTEVKRHLKPRPRRSNKIKKAMRLLAPALILMMPSPPASADQKQFYGADGRNAGRALTDSQGNTTYYGADGRVQARSTTSGNTTTVYGSDGRKTGTVQWQK